MAKKQSYRLPRELESALKVINKEISRSTGAESLVAVLLKQISDLEARLDTLERQNKEASVASSDSAGAAPKKFQL